MAPKLVRLDLVVLTFLVAFSGMFLFSDVLAGTRAPPQLVTPTLRGGGGDSDEYGGYKGVNPHTLSQNERRAIVEGRAGSGAAPGIPPLDNPFPTADDVTVADLERQNPPTAIIAQAVAGNVSLLALADASGGEDKELGNGEALHSHAAKTSEARGVTAADAEKADLIQKKMTELMGFIYNETAIFSDHDAYIIMRRAFQNALLQSRRRFMVEAALDGTSASSSSSSTSFEDKNAAQQKTISSIRGRTRCFQFARDDQKPRDAISRVPCVPWDSPRLHTVAMARYGVLSQYHHVDPPKSLEELRGRVKEELWEGDASFKTRPSTPLRIGVAMSGQMRTYKRCYKTIRDHLLATNEALLFVASYPDVGDKRFGVRVEERDDEVDAGEVAGMFAPYLASMYTVDLPTLTRRLHAEFPTLMVTTQHSWMVYQLFMMDLAQTILLRHHLGAQWTDGAYAPFTVNKAVSISSADGAAPSSFSATPWPSFDVVVRIRPDLYILGPAWIRPLTPTSAIFNFSCGNYTFSRVFSNEEVLRTPHNPYYRWVLDPISDHSAIGFTSKVTSLFELYKDARAMEPSQQEKDIFFHGNTVERMWTQHIDRKKLTAVEVFGWHFMLRHPTKFLNSTNLMSNSERRRRLMLNIFAVSDPATVHCPPRDGKMWVLPPKRRR